MVSDRFSPDGRPSLPLNGPGFPRGTGGVSTKASRCYGAPTDTGCTGNVTEYPPLLMSDMSH